MMSTFSIHCPVELSMVVQHTSSEHQDRQTDFETAMYFLLIMTRTSINVTDFNFKHESDWLFRELSVLRNWTSDL